MVAQADGDDDMEPLTRGTCMRVCGGSFDNFDCIEGHCGQFFIYLTRGPCSLDTTQTLDSQQNESR